MTLSSVRLRLAVFAAFFVLALFAFVYPVRAFLAQRDEVQRVQHDLTVLDAQNRALQREANRLQTPSEIERLARLRFNMVREGERAYAVVGADPGASKPTATTVPPSATP